MKQLTLLAKQLTLLMMAGLPAGIAVAQSPTIQTPASTTLGAVTANTTSAADTFQGTFNGDAKPANLSPLPLSSLLPTGNQTRYIAHLVPPFTLSCGPGATTCKSHPVVGYEENDDRQIARQLTDMQRRGFSVVWLDWFGPENQHHNEVGLKVMHEAERLQGFNFIMQPDHGTVKSCGESTDCNTKMLIEALTYEYKTYESSPAYLRWNGRPVVPFFWNDRTQPVDWDQVKRSVPGNPLFLFLHAKGFSHAASDGAFAWNGIKGQGDIGLAYLQEFYSAAAQERGRLAIGSAYAGFDDRLASWGKDKIIPQQCGMTWLQTMAASLQYQKQAGQAIPFLQVVTWNDYDEGTAIEPGISNCVNAIPARLEGSTLVWDVSFGRDKDGAGGNIETIAYFAVYAAEPADHLQLLKMVPAKERHELDLSAFHLQSGQRVYVEAVGKSMIQNHLSEPVTVQ